MASIFIDKEAYNKLKSYEIFLFSDTCPCDECRLRIDDETSDGLDGTCSCAAFREWDNKRGAIFGSDIDFFVEKCGLSGYFQRIHEYFRLDFKISELQNEKNRISELQKTDKYYFIDDTVPFEVLRDADILKNSGNDEKAKNDGLKIL